MFENINSEQILVDYAVNIAVQRKNSYISVWKFSKLANEKILENKIFILVLNTFQEMNLLFEKADYGMQYRALSHTGAVLGSMADSGLSRDRENRMRSNISAQTEENMVLLKNEK